MRGLFCAAALLTAISCAGSSSRSAPAEEGEAATLGITTRAPSDYEGQCYRLLFETRWQGRVVASVEPGGSAAQAKVGEGDVIVQVGEVTLYSQDDLDDLLRVSRPGDRVELKLRRKDGAAEETVQAILGAARASSGATRRLRWQHASLGQLPFALKEAEKTRKSLLIGLSGAET
jgi:C-terminal processing protease CtpA/Prc